MRVRVKDGANCVGSPSTLHVCWSRHRFTFTVSTLPRWAQSGSYGTDQGVGSALVSWSIAAPLVGVVTDEDAIGLERMELL